jgi:anti-sigma B factor antagonist
MNFSIDHHTGNGAVRLAVAGEVDLGTSGPLGRAILAVITDGRTAELTVGLGEVTFLSSSGIQALLRGHSLAADRGIAYRVTNLGGIVHRVMEVTGVLDILVGPPAPLQQP